MPNTPDTLARRAPLRSRASTVLAKVGASALGRDRRDLLLLLGHAALEGRHVVLRQDRVERRHAERRREFREKGIVHDGFLRGLPAAGGNGEERETEDEDRSLHGGSSGHFWRVSSIVSELPSGSNQSPLRTSFSRASSNRDQGRGPAHVQVEFAAELAVLEDDLPQRRFGDHAGRVAELARVAGLALGENDGDVEAGAVGHGETGPHAGDVGLFPGLGGKGEGQGGQGQDGDDGDERGSLHDGTPFGNDGGAKCTRTGPVLSSLRGRAGAVGLTPARGSARLKRPEGRT